MVLATHRTLLMRRDLYPGASLALDFQGGFYKSRNVLAPRFERLPGVSFSRSSAGTAMGVDGNVLTFAAGAPRITSRGFLLEPSRTNLLLNSSAPATQTVALSAGTYSLSVLGAGSCTASGGSGGVATAGAPLTFTLGSAGPVTFTVAGALSWFQCETGAQPSSFILTGAAAATRLADNCFLVGLKSVLGAGPLTIVVSGELAWVDNGVVRNIVSASNIAGSLNERIVFQRSNVDAARVSFQSGGVNQFMRTLAGYAGARSVKMAVSYAPAGGVYLGAIDATLIATLSGSYPIGMDVMFFGQGPAAPGAAMLEGYLQKVLVYPRTFSQAELNAVTS